MKMIAFFFRHSRKAVLLSVVAGVFSGACNAALLAVINAVLKNNGPASALMWSFVGLCTFLPVTRFSSELLLNKLGQGALYDLRMKLCMQILAAPLRHLEQLGSPRLLAALTDDVPAITNAILMIPQICVNAALVIGCLVYMGMLSPRLLAMVLGFMVLGIITYQFPIIKVQKIFGLARKDTDILQTHFRALTQGTKELKIHTRRREDFIRDSLRMTADSLQRRNIAGQNLYSAASSWGQTLVFVVVGLILFLLPAIQHLNGSMMVAYALTLLYLMTPLQVILNTLPQLSRANVALKKTEELGFTLSSQGVENVAEEEASAQDWRSLELRSVTHVYHREGEGDDFVLGPLDLSFKPGELVFIVGGNGSGKTTLVKLLSGLYTPEKGHILLDGRPIGDADKEFYRQHFSAVFSDFYLFDQMLGLVGPELDRHAREYLAQLKLTHKVKIVDGKLSTTDLSQGQRKRLGLLTAYLEDRPIYVFDEWAADQDPQFKAVFYTRLLLDLKAKGKTVFVITHDDRYYQVADRIIKLDDGQIASDAVNKVDYATASAS
ncbi:MAG TPA: cyclic peptide export ABC transporter [Candidatus Angelobacter sp.]